MGYDDMIEGRGVCLIEWAGLIAGILPESYVSVIITKNTSKGFDYRQIAVEQIGQIGAQG